MKRISKLHYITQDHPEYSHEFLAAEACRGGADWIQLRVKDKSDMEIEKHAKLMRIVCDKYEAKFILNDHVEIAFSANADGVHLGKNDMSPLLARNILGNDKIIGGTANTMDDILRLADAEVDYIGLGPFRFTKTKKNLSPVLGLEGYRTLINQCKKENINIPIIAIGGIVLNDIESLMLTGIHGIAVSSVISFADDIPSVSKQLIEKIG